MKYLLIPFIIMLAGCETPVPVKQRFPEAAPVMLEPAPKLVPLPAGTAELDQLISNTAENYGRYHELVRRYELWQQWYTEQKKNFESAY
jgi:hypothetical protein